jgi:hypothetical protein
VGVWARLEEAATGKTFFVASHHGPLPINTGEVWRRRCGQLTPQLGEYP